MVYLPGDEVFAPQDTGDGGVGGRGGGGREHAVVTHGIAKFIIKERYSIIGGAGRCSHARGDIGIIDVGIIDVGTDAEDIGADIDITGSDGIKAYTIDSGAGYCVYFDVHRNEGAYTGGFEGGGGGGHHGGLHVGDEWC